MGIKGHSRIYLLAAVFAAASFSASGAPSTKSNQVHPPAAITAKAAALSTTVGNSAAAPPHDIGAPQDSKSLGRSKTEDPIARYTFWLDIVTGVLAFFTFVLAAVGGVEIYYLIRTDKTMRDSAEAARLGALAAKLGAESTQASVELSKKAFLSTNRPRIRVKHIWLQRGINDDGAVTLTLVMVNRGDTDATINELRIGCCLTGGEGQIADKVLEDRPRLLTKHLVPSGITLEISDLEGGLSLDKQQSMYARGGNMALYCVGDIQYVDELGRTRKTAFARRWSNGRFRSLQKPDSDYEYED